MPLALPFHPIIATSLVPSDDEATDPQFAFVGAPVCIVQFDPASVEVKIPTPATATALTPLVEHAIAFGEKFVFKNHDCP